jgi:hypothetical protein
MLVLKINSYFKHLYNTEIISEEGVRTPWTLDVCFCHPSSKSPRNHPTSFTHTSINKTLEINKQVGIQNFTIIANIN